ncbi:MAG: hypothetical protein ACK53Y_12655, partial [bacterium]
HHNPISLPNNGKIHFSRKVQYCKSFAVFHFPRKVIVPTKSKNVLKTTLFLSARVLDCVENCAQKTSRPAPPTHRLVLKLPALFPALSPSAASAPLRLRAVRFSLSS